MADGVVRPDRAIDGAAIEESGVDVSQEIGGGGRARARRRPPPRSSPSRSRRRRPCSARGSGACDAAPATRTMAVTSARIIGSPGIILTLRRLDREASAAGDSTSARSPRVVLLVWWLTCLLWSSVWLCIKVGVGDVPPATFASARLVIALLVLLPVVAFGKAPLPRQSRDWLLIGATGFLLLGLNYAFVYWGAQYISSGLTAVLQAATPAFGLIFARLVLDDERVTARQLGGLLLGVTGVAVIFADQLQVTGRAAVWGCAAVTASALCVALGYVLVKRHGTHLRPIELTTGQMIVGLVPLLAIVFTQEGDPFAVQWTGRRDRLGAVSGARRIGGGVLAELLAPEARRPDQAAGDVARRAAHRGRAGRSRAARSPARQDAARRLVHSREHLARSWRRARRPPSWHRRRKHASPHPRPHAGRLVRARRSAAGCRPGASSEADSNRRLPQPTRPKPPRDANDALFLTALAEVLKEPREAIVPRQGPVLVLKNGPHVSARIIPPGTERGIALVTATQLEALATQAEPGHFYYLTLRLLRTEHDQAVVEVALLPAVRRSHVAMCCWSVERLDARPPVGSSSAWSAAASCSRTVLDSAHAHPTNLPAAGCRVRVGLGPRPYEPRRPASLQDGPAALHDPRRDGARRGRHAEADRRSGLPGGRDLRLRSGGAGLLPHAGP